MKSKLLIPIMTIVLVMILIPTSAAEDITNETLENGEQRMFLKPAKMKCWERKFTSMSPIQSSIWSDKCEVQEMVM